MSDPKATFQTMNGCAACVHITDTDPQGVPAAVQGKSYWCKALGKAVDAKDGAQCDRWKPEA